MSKDKDDSSPGDNRGVKFETAGVQTYKPDKVTEAVGVGAFQVKLVLLSSFVWMARAFEMVLIRSLPSVVACDWHLRRWQAGLIPTLTVLSTVLGCFLYGIWSDNYGRRTALSSSLIFLFVFGAVSAGLPTWKLFVIFRVVAAFAIGGVGQALVLCCEYMPSSQRGKIIYILSCFWALGVMIMLCALYNTMGPKGNFRLFVAIGTLPAFVAMVMMRFFPESFRFLMVSGQPFAAREIVAEMMESNQRELPGELKVPDQEEKSRGRVQDLFRPGYMRATLLLWTTGLMTAIVFMGLVFLTPTLLRKDYDIFDPDEMTTVHLLQNLSQHEPCKGEMTTNQFIFTMWTTALDFPGFVVYLILVDIVDRKILLSGSYLVSSVCIFLTFFPKKQMLFRVIFLTIARLLMVSQFELLLLTAAETFPTTHRGMAVGLEAASFYLGQFLSTYLAQGLLMIHVAVPVPIFGLMTLGCAAACVFLEETRGKDLDDVIPEEIREDETEE